MRRRRVVVDTREGVVNQEKASKTVAARERRRGRISGAERSVVEEDTATVAMNHAGRRRWRSSGTNGLDGNVGSHVEAKLNWGLSLGPLTPSSAQKHYTSEKGE
uniref:Uncharacterized protein n=1 Tax=Oryza sativa subsp. japonica TaxID=39947 RepID=Q5VPV1_ORYSJ|nr:hypothetical protein [Oryza sativa Japonica Group]